MAETLPDGKGINQFNTMETITVKVSTAPEWYDIPKAYTLTFTDKERERIRKIYSLILSKLFDRAEYTYYAEACDQEDRDTEQDNSWRPDGCTLNISEYGITYSEYHKHDVSSLIETETVKPEWLFVSHEEETE